MSRRTRAPAVVARILLKLFLTLILIIQTWIKRARMGADVSWAAEVCMSFFQLSEKVGWHWSCKQCLFHNTNCKELKILGSSILTHLVFTKILTACVEFKNLIYTFILPKFRICRTFLNWNSGLLIDRHSKTEQYWKINYYILSHKYKSSECYLVRLMPQPLIFFWEGFKPNLLMAILLVQANDPVRRQALCWLIVVGVGSSTTLHFFKAVDFVISSIVSF